jgi:protein-S-isoprenylcysteine O-methyltransferase Ste14
VNTLLPRIGDFLFRYRNIIFPLCLPLAFLPAPALFDDPLVAAALGFLVSAAGEAVRVTTIGLQYIVRGGRDRRVYAKDLVTGGIYAHTRNPMYVGNVLIFVGLAIASNSWLSLAAIFPVYLFTCVAIVAAEERYLRGRFGDAFEAYCRDVPRWLPRVSGIRSTIADHEFNWRRVVVKEYGTPLGWSWAWGALVLWRLAGSGAGLADYRIATSTVIALMATMLVFWILARVAKKTRRWEVA